MYCHPQRPLPCRRPPPTHASTRDSWTLTGKSESVSCGVTAPFSWVLMHTSFCLCPLSVGFSVQREFWWLYGEVNGGLLQEGLCHTQVCCTRAPAPAAVHCWPAPPQETLKLSSVSVSVGLWVLGMHKVCLSPLLWASLGCMGFDSKPDFVPPTTLLGLLLCPWTWVISSQLLQHNAAATPDYLRSFIIFYMYQI